MLTPSVLIIPLLANLSAQIKLVTAVTQWLSANNFRLPGKALRGLACHLHSHLRLTLGSK